MRQRAIAIALGVAAALSCSSFDARGAGPSVNQIIYTAVETGESVVIDIDRKIIFDGDMSFAMSTCDDEAPLLCIQSKAFDFAVPRDVSKLKPPAGTIPDSIPDSGTPERSHRVKSWTVGQHTYRLISPLGTQAMFNRRVRVAVIKQTSGMPGETWSTSYYYSPKLGLLAYLVNNPKADYTALFILRGRKGVASRSP